MKIINISDLHLDRDVPIGRLDDTSVTQFKKMKYIWDYAQSNNAIILQDGDFFNRPRSWYLLPEVIQFLRGYPKVKVYAVFGGKNHDTYMYSDETRHTTNLGILERIGLVTILGSDPVYFPCIGNYEPMGGICVYGASFGEEIPKIVNKIGTREVKHSFKILVIHAPIAMKPLYYGDDYISASKFLKKYKEYDLVFCGDIHRQFIYKDKEDRIIANTGPVVRRKAEEYNFKHKPCFFEFDSKEMSLDIKVIPHKPAKEVLNRNHIERQEETGSMLNDFISSMEEEFDPETDLLNNLQAFMKANKISKSVKRLITNKTSQPME